eukprot:scaffold108453_cov38-Cyclotella_meneghiniana.AAC.2
MSYLDRSEFIKAIDKLDEEGSPVKFIYFSYFFSAGQDHAIQIRLTEEEEDADGRFPGKNIFNVTVDDFYPNDWERLGAAIGRNATVYYLSMVRDGLADLIENIHISRKLFQCMEAFYRGLQLNTSIEVLDISMDLFPFDGSLPTLNLQEVRFKKSLKELRLEGPRGTINDNQSAMIESILESTSLETFNVCNCTFETDTAFSRVILACSKTASLIVRCGSLSQYDSVAALLRDPRSILSLIYFDGDIDERGLSTIATGLTNNTTLRKLHFYRYSGDWRPMVKALCDTSSIEQIIASNHTLESVSNRNVPYHFQDYLTLNTSTNKEQVIRTKIARYYFQGDFDLSTLANMDMKCFPRVLAMIGGGEMNCNAATFRGVDTINQQSAIFRILKCIPGLCNVSSRINGNGDSASDSTENKRQKVLK